MEKSLDEIISDKSSQRKLPSSKSRQTASASNSYRPYSRSNRRHSPWKERSHSPPPGRHPSSRHHEPGVTIKVTNLHYELLENDVENLLSRVGQPKNIKIVYDRGGRSEGIAFATFNTRKEAQSAIDKFDGQMAAGSPITVIIERDNSLANILGTTTNKRRPPRPHDLEENGKWVRGQKAPNPRPTRTKAPSHASTQDLDADLDEYWRQRDSISKDDSQKKDKKDTPAAAAAGSQPITNPVSEKTETTTTTTDLTQRLSRDTEMVLE